MTAKQYAQKYIKHATTSNSLEAPNAKQAGEFIEALQALFEAHRTGGAEGASRAWQAVKRFTPTLDVKEKLIPADELKNIEIPDYILSDYPIYNKGTNLLIGTRGAGKSFIALDVSAKIAFYNPTRSVIYCAGEAISSYAPRWEAWKKWNNKHPKNLIFWDNALQFLNEDEMNEFRNAVTPLKPCFVVIDTVARSMAGANENDTAVMSGYISAGETLAKELNTGLLLVHHEGRNGMQRGSSALDGAVDSVLAVKREDKTLIIYNDIEHGGKNRHQAEQDPKKYEFLPIEIEINGVIRTSAVINPLPDMPEDEEESLTPKQALIIEALEAHGNLTAQDLTAVTGISKATLYRHLTPLIKDQKVFLNKSEGLYTLESLTTHPQ